MTDEQEPKDVEEEQKEKETQEPKEEEAAPETQRRPPLPEASFSTFVHGLGVQCLLALGAMENPVTKKRELDLEQAKYTIDILQIMEEKTKGNLTAEEAKLLRGLLYDLRMRYVDACRG